MQRIIVSIPVVALCALAAVPATAQPTEGLQRITPSGTTALRQWDQRIETMLDSGDLRVQQRVADNAVAGRVHERAAQFHRGVPVQGADVTRQLDGAQTVSMFGALYSGIDIDVAPGLTPQQAAAVLERHTGQALGASRMPALVVLPLNGSYVLAWRARVATTSDVRLFFVDARTGAIVKERSDMHRQSAIGRGVGVLGDEKKMSVTPGSGGFVASDVLRPPSLMTFDMKGNLERLIDILNGRAPLLLSDRAADADNNWSDGAAVDAHAYAGLTYDYFYRRHGRRGLDDQNAEIFSFVHPVKRQDIFTYPDEVVGTFYVNAFYCCGGVMVYGEGIPAGYTLGGLSVDYQSGALDVIAHELTHGVTDYTSALEYENESGALSETFSDVMGTAVEFFFQEPGSGLRRADYLIGEDTWRPGGIRSLADPGSFGDPDHYSKRYTGTLDNGGVHTNSGIGNQAFYLAISGGANRTSGIAVTGVGSANREQIEKVFYRAFTLMLPANSTLSTARAATIQAARDLYGAGGAVERAITQAWAAVGVS